MAKAKQAEQAAFPLLVITPEKGLPVDGNFQEILGYLKRREKEVAKLDLSEDNLDQAKLVKKEAGAYRKAVEERLKTTIALLFDGPKDVLKSKAQELFNAIASIESAAEKALDQAEEERVADLNRAYETYKDSFQALYRLDESRLVAIELRKWYYNKTPPGNEKKAKDDLEQQFKDLKQAQDAREADIKMVRALCANEPRLNVQTWIDRLNIVPLSFIAGELAMEKERLAELDKPAPEPQALGGAMCGYADEDEDDDPEPDIAAAEQQAPVVRLGIMEQIANFKTDFPGRTLKKRFELEYPCDMGDLMTELFKELRQHSVTARAIKEEVVF
jgi:hypothetical protein